MILYIGEEYKLVKNSNQTSLYPTNDEKVSSIALKIGLNRLSLREVKKY